MASPPSRRTSSSSSAVNYPFPSEVNVWNFVPQKLGRSNYHLWKQPMLNMLESHELEGFVDGTIQPPPLPLEEHKQEEYSSWKRSDGLVRGWILVAVTDEMVPQLVNLATAREAWIELEKTLSPPAPSLPQPIPKPERTYQERATNASKYLPLYKAILKGNWDTATGFLKHNPDGIRDAITLESETALMVAVRSSKRNHIVKKLIADLEEMDAAQLDINGETALFKAVYAGNNEAAKLLLAKNPKVPSMSVTLQSAAMHGNREMFVCLLEAITVGPVGDVPDPFEGPQGLEILMALAYGELYDIASTFLQRYPMLAAMEPSPLVVMISQHSSFHSRTLLNFFESIIYICIPLTLEDDANSPSGRDIENSTEGVNSVWCYMSQRLNGTFWYAAEKLVPQIKSVRETKLIHHQALKFVKNLCKEVVKPNHLARAKDVLGLPLGRAAFSGISEIVEEILDLFPSGLLLCTNNFENIFHAAIENRQENVFNIIYQLEKHQKDYFLSQVDVFGNNSLHMAGKFAPAQQLSLKARVACPALQMQRELQWFKEIEKLMLPKAKYAMNNDQRTPGELFSEMHKDLVKEGEKWIKDTTTSCTIVAALIVTVVFAAAIIVPGGNKGDSGLPIFLEDGVFVLFGVFDALALFSSTASLLMFLSIFTSRYGEQDFLYSLPRKLIIGLVFLFLSIISMMIAFGATLKIVFGNKKEWVVIPIVLLSSVPITLFALLQFPLLLDMIRSTYYPGTFWKRSNNILY